MWCFQLLIQNAIPAYDALDRFKLTIIKNLTTKLRQVSTKSELTIMRGEQNHNNIDSS